MPSSQEDLQAAEDLVAADLHALRPSEGDKEAR